MHLHNLCPRHLLHLLVMVTVSPCIGLPARADDRLILQRLEALEADNKALRETVKQLEIRLGQTSSPSRGDSTRHPKINASPSGAVVLEESVTAKASASGAGTPQRLNLESPSLASGALVLDKVDVSTTGPSIPAPSLKLSGYLDVGYFVPQGDGRGFIFDTQNAFRPEYPDVPWILLGDPWSTPVNSRGDPADTSGSFAFPSDPIDSEGHASFIVNELNIDLVSALSPTLSFNGSLDFFPRSGVGGELNDEVEVDLAYVEWSPFEEANTSFFLGKYDSAFGREYRFQESPDRTGIAPSLIFRYVGGHPVGIKARSKFFDEKFILNTALNTGSSHIESFPFSEEIDSNSYPSVSERVSYEFDIGDGKLDWGISGEWGPQSGQGDNSIFQFQFGSDAQFEWSDFSAYAEFVQGEAEGGGAEGAEFLDFQGAATEFRYALRTWVTPYVGWSYRDAIHQGDTFIYIVDIMRYTTGLRFDISNNTIFKVEYLRNLERGKIPDFENDLILSSFIFKF